MTGDCVAVTGANGFLGRALVAALAAQGLSVRAIVRRAPSPGAVAVGDIGPTTDWSTAMAGVDTVIHTAARTHVTHDTADDPPAVFREVNAAGTRRLAEQAAKAGVRRLIFVSTVKVNGETTQPGRPFAAEDVPAPCDSYALSKWEAEQALHAVSMNTGLKTVIIRSPLMYGPGVKANFLSLLRAVARGLPLPLGLIRNHRSLVALANLVDLIVTCLEHPAAVDRTFLVSDGEDLSTPELVRRLARALGRPAHLFPMPTGLLMAGATLLGKQDAASRLCESLQVDLSTTRELLGWVPPVTVDAALASVADWFLDQSGTRYP